MLVLISVKTGPYLGPWANVVIDLRVKIALLGILLVVPIVCACPAAWGKFWVKSNQFKDPTNTLHSLTAPHQRELIRTAAEFGDTTNQNYLMSAGGFATAVETRCASSAAPIPPISNTNGSWGAISTQRPTTIWDQGPR